MFFADIITQQLRCSMTQSSKIQKLKGFFELVLGFILPKDTDVSEIEKLSLEEISEKVPRAGILEENKCKALFQYKNKIARKAVWEIKYRGNGIIAEKFSKLFYEFILGEISDEMLFSNFTNPILVPIPASKTTLKERGFNQCELISKEMRKIDGEENFEISFGALKKIKDTPHQSRSKNRAERLENLKDSFGADAEKVKGRNIIVIDDVITTGATMREAAKTLRQAGAKKVLCFAIAH